jgi:hypothetical protein
MCLRIIYLGFSDDGKEEHGNGKDVIFGKSKVEVLIDK